MNLSTIFQWLSLRDYDQAKADSTRKIMGRYARGNVLVQAGRYLNEADAHEIVMRGDKAVTQLERAARSR